MLDKIFDLIYSRSIFKLKNNFSFQVDEKNNEISAPSFGFSIYDVKICT
jgi:hypothetical protein